MADTTVKPPSIDRNDDLIALPVGASVGRYTIRAVLGQGSFGITYRAADTQLGRDVALKEYLPAALAVRGIGLAVVPNSTRSAEDFAWGRQRFTDEARVLAGFQRVQGIVHVNDFLEANGTAYIVMELVQGETLGARLKRQGQLSAPQVERTLRVLLDGLETLHAASFIHRDIKPDNILIDEGGYPTLIDFGAARAAVAGRTSALTGVFTPGYAAVEQFTDARQGPSTDIYALSATLYQSITGEKPPNAIDRVLDDKCVPLAVRRPAGFSPALLGGIDRGMSVRPEARPQTITTWRPLLFPEERPDDLTSVPAPAQEKPRRWRTAASAGLAVAILLGAACGAWFLVLPKEPVIGSDRQQAAQIGLDAATAPAEKRTAEEEAQRLAAVREAQRKADEAAVAADRRRAEEQEAERRRAEDGRRQTEAERLAAERRQAEEVRRQAEAEREAAERRQAEEVRRQADADRQRRMAPGFAAPSPSGSPSTQANRFPTMSDADVCRTALAGQNWDQRPEYERYRQEAERRGYDAATCREATLGLRRAGTPFPARRPSSRSDFVSLMPGMSDRDVCQTALDRVTRQWEARPEFASYLQEAYGRNLTSDYCATLLSSSR